MLDRNTYSGSMRCSCGVVDGLRHLFFFLSLLRPNKKIVFVIIAGVVLLVQEAGSGFLVHTLCTLLSVSRPSPPLHTRARWAYVSTSTSTRVHRRGSNDSSTFIYIGWA